MMSTEPKTHGWIFAALAIWNLLCAVSFTIQADVFLSREGFYYRPIWFTLPNEMIGLCPHLGYLLAWAFNHHPWDASLRTGGIFELLIVSFTALLALALYSRQRWAGFLAAVVALLVAAAQFQRVHFLMYRWGWLSCRNVREILDNGMATGAFTKLIATLVSALLAITLLRVLFLEAVHGKAGAIQSAPIPSDGAQQTRQFLIGALLLSALMLLVLARVTPANLSEYFGQRSGFSAVFQLLASIPVGVAAAGLWITGGRFFVGLAFGYAVLFPIPLLVTWYLELANPGSPVHHIKAPVWIAFLVCLGILAASILMVHQGRHAGSAHQGKFSIGVIVSLAFLAASLDACNMQGFLRN